ncbi:peroxiredoxin [Natronoglycomyces albus]|uniref:Alkyl hydroperoxide reductase E n=1 Tax=Natronoglycomyces albus TaxID=2811108 RepID=A0A895XLB1_9ACTN|nr:peroxiredoxin [Natronoglycomyces albus]QSB04209.1 peroxiredoxin [Natronoglycomyces albus]
MTISVGQAAPEFTLKDQNNQEVSLQDFAGDKNVLLVFYPLAFTGVCEGELCGVRDDLDEYQTDDVQVLTVSVDSPFTHKVWAEREGFTFPLLSDFWPHGGVATQYGVFDADKGISNRGTFVIDKQGIVQFAEMNLPGEPRDQQGWKKALAELSGK